MKLSINWLREHLPKNIDLTSIDKKLTMAGLESKLSKCINYNPENIVVGLVENLKQHPDAEKLKVCTVNVGQDESLSIVCGANNVYSGMKVAVALIGSELPGGKIKKSKLRGIESCGMLCSASELSLGADEGHGILDLPQDAVIGQTIKDFFAFDDEILEVELTPNRGDCASVFGIAREICALNRVKFFAPAPTYSVDNFKNNFKITVTANESCPKYCARILKNINNKISTPYFIKERLRRSDIGFKSLVVDVLNYTMLLFGQPMHAFDFDNIDEEIIVRYSKNGEKILLLNNQEVVLDTGALVISDKKNVLAIAGIMGGFDSAVTCDTKNIILESAYFIPEKIFTVSQKYNLKTDSSYRFERGVDFNIQEQALDFAVNLITTLTKAEIKKTELISLCAKEFLPKLNKIYLAKEKITSLLGCKIPDKIIEDIILSLCFTIEDFSNGWSVVSPSFRFDITCAADLVEEIGRLYGYDNIPAITYNGSLTELATLDTKYNLNLTLRLALRDRGFNEAINYSFLNNQAQKYLFANVTSISIQNPISADMDVLRVSLWPNLLKNLEYNLNRDQKRLRLFEIGANFTNVKEIFVEQECVGGLIYGSRYTLNWGAKEADVDFFDLKADVEILLKTLNVHGYHFAACEHVVLHPGQSAAIMQKENIIGYIGALNPKFYKEFSLNKPTFLFEIFLDKIDTQHINNYKLISKFQAVTRDLSFVVEKNISAETILEIIKNTVQKLLYDVFIFDVFEFDKDNFTQKSIACRLILQDNSRTLNDDSVNKIINRVISALAEKVGANLRS